MPETLTAVRERPFIAKPHEVRAMKEGRMTQFRRPMKPQPYLVYDRDWYWSPSDFKSDDDVTLFTPGTDDYSEYCPFGAPGDVLWVKETWGLVSPDSEGDAGWYDLLRSRLVRDHPDSNMVDGIAGAIYRADGEHSFNPDYLGWRSSIHMPRWASRLKHEIVDVKVERVCEISEEDAIAQGAGFRVLGTGNALARDCYELDGFAHASPQGAFSDVWERDFPNHPWESSWVWAITFRLIDKEARHAR